MMKMSELIIASKNGYFSRVIELLQSGISVKCRDRDNATALYWSACRGYARICAVLVKAGSDIDARVKWGSTALHACSDRGHKDCVETLISFGADLNIQNVRGDTPLHLAGYRGYADIVIILIEARADTTLLNEKKKSAEQEARGQGHTRVANILQNHREANLSPPDWDDSGFKRTRREDLNVFPDSDLTTTLGMMPPSSITQTQLNIGLNQLSADRKTGDLGSEFGYPRRFSTGWAVLRETTEPQESEEPCSASSWNGCEKISNLSNGQHSHSDTIAEKRVKHSICVSQLPRPDPLGLDSSPRQKPCSAGDLITSQSSSFSNSDSQLNENRPDFTDLGGKSTFPLASKSKLPLAKTNSDFVENQVLRRRLEEVSRYAENLELKLVTSNEKIINLEGSVREKQSLLKQREEQQQQTDQKVSMLTQMARESETLQLSLAEERSLSATLQGRCEALSDEVQRLRLELKTVSDLQSKHQPVGEITPVARIECDAKLSTKQELSDKRAGSSSAGVLADSEECGVTKLAKTRQFSPTYSQVLQALKLCIGDSILSDRQLYSLNQRYRQVLQSQCRGTNIQQQQALDIANKEWRAGVDYTLLDDRPVNQRDGGHREGTSSLVFRISHHRKTYILKMMINLLDLQSVGHGKGQSLPSFLQYNFSAEYEIPLNLPPHENIIQILHFYEGSTIRFRQHLRLLVPSSLDVPLDMANRTVFMVLQEYPFTLKSLALERRTNQPNPPFGLPDRFLVLLLYQLLSAVAHLVQHDVVHRDIKADNVFLDRRLRPVLADFGFAKRVCESNGDKVMFRDAEQVMAGNSNAWAPELARLNRGGPDSLPTEASLDQVYQKTDAYAVSRMFYGLLRPLVAADDFPLSSAETPHYDEASIPPLPDCISPGLSYVLRQLVLDDPRDRPAARKAMVLVGMMLFGPRKGEVNTPAEFMAFYQAKLIQHLTVPVIERLDDEMPGILSVEESVTENSPALEVHLLTHTTPQEMWECCKIIRQYSLYL